VSFHGELVALRKRISGVRLNFTGLSGEPTVACANGRPRNLRATRGLIQRSASALQCAPDNVRCANHPEEQRSDMPNLEGDCAPDSLQDLSSGAPDYPVCHSTEGKIGLPSWSSTAPSYLGAIKGTPKRMEEDTNIL
jgi:hypothetical protein